MTTSDIPDKMNQKIGSQKLKKIKFWQKEIRWPKLIGINKITPLSKKIADKKNKKNDWKARNHEGLHVLKSESLSEIIIKKNNRFIYSLWENRVETT